MSSTPVSIYRRGTTELRKRIDELHLVQKAGVAPATAVDVDAGFSNPEVFSVVKPGSITGKMTSLREVKFLRRQIRPTAASRGYWVGQGAPKPLSRFALEGTFLPPLTLATLIVLTDEAVKFQDPLTDQATRADVVRANTERLDASFIDVSNTGIPDVEPASITSTGAQIESVHNPSADVAAAIANFLGDFGNAYWNTDPLTATQMSLARDSFGNFEFPDCGPRGGTILGIPLITSRGSPRDTTTYGQLALVDASAIAIALDGMNVDTAKGAAIQMSDDPEDPNANTAILSLFQHNLIALRTVLHANWEVMRPGAVVTVVGCEYSAS
jgi:hypothetical protein